MNKWLILIFITITGVFSTNCQCEGSNFEILLEKVYFSADTLFMQARSVVWADKQYAMITMSIHGIGTHAYGDIYTMNSNDGGKNWGTPRIVKPLKRHLTAYGYLRSIGDLTPDWHEKTKTILATGKSFFFQPEDSVNVKHRRLDIESIQEVAYTVYQPESDDWSATKTLELPEKLDNGEDFCQVNAGCTQRVDLPDGNILLPIRYHNGKNGTSTVVLCSYDGQELKYVKHGSTFTVPEKRGLLEPSICRYKDHYYLTMRGDDSAYVARSRDGLYYEPMKNWMFSDNTWLGSYNTQQHWISHPKHGLFLVYTRRGADNDHVFRHRAPLFIARVDPEKLHVIKETERVLIPIPSDFGDVGNFGITHIDEDETWVTAPVTPKKLNDSNRTSTIYIAKIKWGRQ